MSTLILIRHGQSEWNAQNRFTGWVNVALTQQGKDEAVAGAQRLAALGLRVDIAFTSELARAIDTGRLVLDQLGQPELEQIQAWQLNERFYGALTGRDKEQTRQEFGAEQVHIWRRSYDIAPPAGESLKDTGERTLPYFNDSIVPATADHDVTLVSAHGNSLRAIIKELEGLSDAEIPTVEIATGVPYVYEMSQGTATGKQILAPS
ncbi:MAG: 2,3-bisphosphoglycerate-dependent phosphoglycerate mutase [Euzebya sp.]